MFLKCRAIVVEELPHKYSIIHKMTMVYASDAIHKMNAQKVERSSFKLQSLAQGINHDYI